MNSFSGLQFWLREPAKALLRLFPKFTVTSTYRGYTEQLALWNNRHRNPYPVAPPGRSYHGFGRAFDVSGSADELAAAGAVWQRWGGTWSPKDPIHFQA